MNRRGFTLIEMAIVMVIIGLVFTGATTIAMPVFTSEKIDLTQRRMAVIQQALQVYVIQNGCLPCPADGSLATTDTNAGLALAGGASYTSCTSTACQSTNKVVPWRTLGLSEDDASDGWKNRIRYVVGGNNSSGGSCAASTGTVTAANGMVRVSTSCFPAGTLSLANIDVSTTAEISNAVYILISSGPDTTLALKAVTGASTGDRYSQNGGGGGQDLNHQNSPANYAYGSLNSSNGTSHFDDIVRFMSAPIIIQKCGASSCGNPA